MSSGRGESLWPLRLLALGIALIVWGYSSYIPRVQRALQPKEVKYVEAPVRYELAQGLTILNGNQSVTLELRGRDEALSEIKDNDLSVRIPSEAGLTEGSYPVPLDRDWVAAPEGIEIAGITPNTLSLIVDIEETREIAVAPAIFGEPAAGATVEAILVEPARVLVRGPKTRLDEIFSVPTAPINLNSHAFSFSPTVALEAPGPLITLPETRTVVVHIDLKSPATPGSALTNESTDAPLDDPDGTEDPAGGAG